MEPLRVLHLCAGNLYGGVERLLVTLARAKSLCPEIEPTYALCFEGQLSEELRASGAEVHLLGAVRASRPWTVWAARRRLAGVLREGGFHAVVAHGCWPYALFVGVGRAAGTPVVLWCHDILNGEHWTECKSAKAPPDLILANSRVTAHSAAKVFPAARVVVQRLPVMPVEMGDGAIVRAEVRRELSTPEDGVVVVCTSRLERWKGHRELIQALALLSGDASWRCWIAGGAQKGEEAAYLEELKSLAAGRGVSDRVRFLGHRRDVPRLLLAADVHCQPNTGPEPFGVAFVEAMSAGLAVVTSNIGGAVEIVEQGTGVLVGAGDVSALAKELERVIRNSQLRRELGERARVRARELCDPGLVMGELDGVLREVVAGLRPCPLPQAAMQARAGHVHSRMRERENSGVVRAKV